MKKEIEKALVTISCRGTSALKKKNKELSKELQGKIMKLLEGKYKGVPMLVMHNLTIKGKMKEGVFISLPSRDAHFIITHCHIKI